MITIRQRAEVVNQVDNSEDEFQASGSQNDLSRSLLKADVARASVPRSVSSNPDYDAYVYVSDYKANRGTATSLKYTTRNSSENWERQSELV